jgi:NADP-dependent 3-hydroxy acid dehydrogenase YdfG
MTLLRSLRNRGDAPPAGGRSPAACARNCSVAYWSLDDNERLQLEPAIFFTWVHTMTKRLVAITGASSGIGAALAKEFSRRGHPTLLMARRIERIRAMELPGSTCAQVDVTDFAALKRAVESAESEHGAVDCMINCAGVMLLGLAVDQDIGEWKSIFDVNVMGMLNGIKVVLPSMVERRCGTIIDISSIAGLKSFPKHSVYCGAKSAVRAISEAMREEASESGVRFVVVSPGAVETELLGHTTSQQIIDDYEAWKGSMGGVLNAEDIVRAIVFAYEQPQHVCVREIVLAATGQAP